MNIKHTEKRDANSFDIRAGQSSTISLQFAFIWKFFSLFTNGESHRAEAFLKHHEALNIRDLQVLRDDLIPGWINDFWGHTPDDDPVKMKYLSFSGVIFAKLIYLIDILSQKEKQINTGGLTGPQLAYIFYFKKMPCKPALNLSDDLSRIGVPGPYKSNSNIYQSYLKIIQKKRRTNRTDISKIFPYLDDTEKEKAENFLNNITY